MSGTSVQVLSDSEEVGHAAAKIFIDAAESSTASAGRFVVAISGGSTPIKFFALLGSGSYASKICWPCIHFFWVDERCVPEEDKDSNFGAAWGSLLSHVSIPETNIHRIKGDIPPEEAALEYENELKRFFGSEGVPAFDLVFLGMGEDGHTASIFPASDSLNESQRLAVPVYVEKLKSWRITLTLPVLNNASSVVFLVAGKNKADVLKEILENKSHKYPAGLIKPDHGDLIWLVDEDAAGEIKSSKSPFDKLSANGC